jgi:hypothetical protein
MRANTLDAGPLKAEMLAWAVEEADSEVPLLWKLLPPQIVPKLLCD